MATIPFIASAILLQFQSFSVVSIGLFINRIQSLWSQYNSTTYKREWIAPDMHEYEILPQRLFLEYIPATHARNTRRLNVRPLKLINIYRPLHCDVHTTIRDLKYQQRLTWA